MKKDEKIAKTFMLVVLLCAFAGLMIGLFFDNLSREICVSVVAGVMITISLIVLKV